MEELYDYLLSELDLTCALTLPKHKQFILYYRENLEPNVNSFYEKCIDDKNAILDKLPNGFKFDGFVYDDEYISFQIKKK